MKRSNLVVVCLIVLISNNLVLGSLYRYGQKEWQRDLPDVLEHADDNPELISKILGIQQLEKLLRKRQEDSVKTNENENHVVEQKNEPTGQSHGTENVLNIKSGAVGDNADQIPAPTGQQVQQASVPANGINTGAAASADTSSGVKTNNKYLENSERLVKPMVSTGRPANNVLIPNSHTNLPTLHQKHKVENHHKKNKTKNANKGKSHHSLKKGREERKSPNIVRMTKSQLKHCLQLAMRWQNAKEKENNEHHEDFVTVRKIAKINMPTAAPHDRVLEHAHDILNDIETEEAEEIEPIVAKSHVNEKRNGDSVLNDKILWLGIVVGSGFSLVTTILCCCFYKCLLQYRDSTTVPLNEALSLFKASESSDKSPMHIRLSQKKGDNKGKSQYVVSIMGKNEMDLDSSSEEEEVFNRSKSSLSKTSSTPITTPSKTKKPILQ